jgi:hypothetical protein
VLNLLIFKLFSVFLVVCESALMCWACRFGPIIRTKNINPLFIGLRFVTKLAKPLPNHFKGKKHSFFFVMFFWSEDTFIRVGFI